MSHGTESKKSHGNPTVEYSGKPCSQCETTDNKLTVLLRSTPHDFKGVVCAEHLFSMLRKWQKHAQATDEPKPKTA